jgi:hypothetical protein
MSAQPEQVTIETARRAYQATLDELTYRSYQWNRMMYPLIAWRRWGILFGVDAVERYETRFQGEQWAERRGLDGAFADHMERRGGCFDADETDETKSEEE